MNERNVFVPADRSIAERSILAGTNCSSETGIMVPIAGSIGQVDPLHDTAQVVISTFGQTIRELADR